MTVFYIPLILVCPLLGPCNRSTAYESVALEPVSTPIACLMAGGQKAADLAFIPRNGENATYVIRCEVRK